MIAGGLLLCNGVAAQINKSCEPQDSCLGISGQTLLACTQRDQDPNTGWWTGRFSVDGGNTWRPEFVIASADQNYWCNSKGAICLQDGRWLIPLSYNSQSIVCLTSPLGASVSTVESSANAWSSYSAYTAAMVISSGLSDGSIAEPSAVQLNNGQILLVSRSNTYAIMSLGTVNPATGAIAFADPTNAANGNTCCKCDGGMTGSQQRPLLWSGNSPVTVFTDTAYLYFSTGTAIYAKTRGVITVYRVKQTDFVAWLSGSLARLPLALYRQFYTKPDELAYQSIKATTVGLRGSAGHGNFLEFLCDSTTTTQASGGGGRVSLGL